MGRYFGTDGFRGEAGIDLTADHAYKVGRFLGWYYNALRERNGNNEPARIVIGKDTRRSSYMFEYVAMFCYPEEYQLGIRPMNKDDIIEVDNLSELIALDASYKKYVEEK